MAETPSELPELLHELNDRVYKLLRLGKSERILVEDFVQFKRFAIKGKVCEETAGVPDPKELERYAEVLQAELDGFFEDNPRLRHRVEILYDKTSGTGMIDVELLKNSRGPLRVKVQPVGRGYFGRLSAERRVSPAKARPVALFSSATCGYTRARGSCC